MDMPGYLDYGKMMEMNPIAYAQAQNQMGLAQQFQQNKLAQEQETLRKSQLQNMFDEQNNPFKLQRTQLDNAGVQEDNASKARANRIAAATEDVDIKAKTAEALKKVSMAELDDLQARAERLAMSTNPQEAAVGKQLLTQTKSWLQEKQKHEYEMAKQKDSQTFTAGENKLNRGTQVEVAKISADARKNAKSGSPTDFWTLFYKTTGAKNKYAMLNAQAQKLDAEGDAAEATKMRQIAAQLEPQVQAEIASARPGTPDIAAMTNGQVPVNQAPNIAPPSGGPAGNPRPAATAAPRAPQVGQVVRGYRFNGGDPSKKENWTKE